MAAASRIGLRSFSIPTDIIVHLLTASPSFRTLHTSVGVCKTWHGVFAAHPKSITLSVARNVAGSALPQAVRFLRFPYPEKIEWDWGSLEDEDWEKGPSSENAAIGELSPRERVCLEKNASVVKQLENIFSSRHKDRTSKTSRLTTLESHRFSRAMYRIMLYCELFYRQLNLDNIDAMEDEPETLEKIQKRRHALLNEYPTPELLEIRAVVAFLHDIIRELLYEDDFDRAKDICLSTGPEVILQSYLTKESLFEDTLEPEVLSSGEDNAFFGGFFSKPLEKIWAERKTVLPPPSWDAIVDEVFGQDDACTQCGVVAGLKLWSEANWQNLITVPFWALLKGNLTRNNFESAPLANLVIRSPKLPPDVVAEIFDLERSPEFATLKKSDGLCTECLHKLISEHLHLWLFERKVADGWTPTQNCPKGYDCKAQMYDQKHAEEANHLCSPIK